MLNKITNHIYQLQVPIPYDLGLVNCYIIEGSNGYTIVDTGDYTEEAIALWEEVLPTNKPIEKVLLTHAHTDHIGLAGWFQKKYNASIWISKAGFNEIQKILSDFEGSVYSSPLSSFFQLNGGPIHPEEDNRYHNLKAYEFEPSYIFDEGEIIPIGDCDYESIWTPGHSPDHFSFYNRCNQILFVGDHILQSLNPIVMASNMNENPLALYFQALDKLLPLPTRYVLPGHGSIIENLKLRIENMKEHYKKRWNQISNAVNRDGVTAFQVSQSIYGVNQPVERMMSGFLQTITHLIYLASIEEVTMKEQGGILYYYPNDVK